MGGKTAVRVTTAAAVAAALTVLAAGCGTTAATGDRAAGRQQDPGAATAPASPAPAPSPTAFDRNAAQTDLDRSVAAAGLSVAAGKRRETAAPSGQPLSAKDAVVARMVKCSVTWQSLGGGKSEAAGTGAGDERAKYDAVVTELGRRGWQVDHPAREEPLDEERGEGAAVHQVLEKRGWTLRAGYYDMSGIRMLSFQGFEDACESRFSEDELALLERQGEG
ncbi:hypothetical protein [Streptomyces sp. NPDC012888]|uniref:hypothetical protein n=1 Tax=Streptomyces sp. NPDC012888 TaxID=3364855 RepID=UPI0036D19B30